MTLEDIYFIGQTIAVVAILGSLIALIIQMRQANRLARAAAVRTQLESLQTIVQAVYRTPGLAELIAKGNTGQSLSEIERMQVTAYLTEAERTWEALFETYRNGLVDPELWEAHRKQARAFSRHPLNRAVWELRKDWYTKAYRDYRDADCPVTKDDDPLRYHAPPISVRSQP